jgi:hypothetical protein
MVLVGAGLAVLQPDRRPWWYLGYLLLLVTLLVAVCWLKGEPPRWRCGSDDDA